MERTPKSKISLSHKSKQLDKYDIPVLEDLVLSNSENVRTPTQNSSFTLRDNDCSPLYVPCTQEAFDQLDVVWDWNSPQSKQPKLSKTKKSHKRHSPKLSIKKHPSNNQIESYDKLKTELEALKNQWAHGSRDCDKSFSKALFNDNTCDGEDKLKDFFEDDSLEEEMILQSQKIEELFTMEIKNNDCDVPGIPARHSNIENTSLRSDIRKVKSDILITQVVNGVTIIKKNNSVSNINTRPQRFINHYTDSVKSDWSNIKDDSFDIAFESFVGDELVSEEPINHKQILNKSMKDKCEKLNVDKICNSNEIEQKRLEAIAKLKAKSQQVSSTNIIGVNKEDRSNKDKYNHHISEEESSPIKCSPEEIEQKRLQALAKLEAKKKQDIIERNRREALKRLEMNKKKRAMASQNLCNKKK